jgi:hypothetical protein
MTDDEAIAAVREGRRATTPTSRWPNGAGKPNANNFDCEHFWRTIACNDVTDVIECSKCAEQRLARCNFDDDFA